MTLSEYQAYLKGKKRALKELKDILQDDRQLGLDRNYKKRLKRRCKEDNLFNTKTKEFFKYLNLKGKVSMYHYIDDKINKSLGFVNYQYNNTISFFKEENKEEKKQPVILRRKD